MNDKKKDNKDAGKPGTKLIMTMVVDEENAKRVRQLYDEGYFEGLHIKEFRIDGIKQPDPKKKWSQSELRKRHESQDDGITRP